MRAAPAGPDRPPLPEPCRSHFWEAGHFKKALGDEVLNTLLGAPTGLGMRLDAQNLPAWLAQDQASMQRLLSEPSALRDFTQVVLRQAGVVTPR